MNIAVLAFVLYVTLCDAHLGPRRGDGGDRRGGHHRGPPPPPYLEVVTEEPRREYFTIVSSMDKTIVAQRQEILEWGEKFRPRGMSGEVGGEDMIEKPSGRGRFRGFGRRPQFGGFTGDRDDRGFGLGEDFSE